MALKHIKTAAMLALTRHWRTTARHAFDRPLLRDMPTLLDAIEGELASLTQALEGMDPATRIAELTAQTKALDREHDDLLGRIYNFLTATAELYDPGDHATATLELRDRLFPGGLIMKRASFQAQGGAALQAKAALTNADRALLGGLSVANIDLAGMVDTWIETAEKLQQADAERATVLQQSRDVPADEHALRLEWIRLARIIRNAAPVGELSEDDAALLFAKLDAESARRGRRTSPAPDAEQPEQTE